MNNLLEKLMSNLEPVTRYPSKERVKEEKEKNYFHVSQRLVNRKLIGVTYRKPKEN